MIKQRISDIGDVILKKSNNEKLPYIEIGDIDVETKKYIRKDKPAVKGALKAKKDHVIISKVRPTRGAVSIVSEDCLVSNAFVVLQTRESIIPKYLFYSIAYNKRFFLRLGKLEKGTSYPSCRAEDILTYKIPLPTISEQNEIVKILNTADSLRQKRKEQLALLDDYLKSVFLEIFGEPISNDKKWPLVELNSIIENIDSGWSPVCVDNQRESEDIPVVLKLGAATYCVFDQSKYKIIPKGVHIKKRVEVQLKDLLFTRKNTKDLVGASAYVFQCKRNLLLPDTIFRLNYKNTLVSGIYLWKLFTERGFRKVIQNLATGSAGSMPNISKEKLKKLEIPFPQLNIQIKFASIVEQVEQVKQKIRDSLHEMDNHFNVLMQRYFG